ncbi:MAG: serine hydrolase domain-containing protein [Friedmanniella sp.]
MPSSSGEDLGARISALVEPLMHQLTVPGVVVAVQTPSERWLQAFGSRSLSSPDERVTSDDHFRIGSNTKTITGTCVLQLVDEGKVGLADPVSDHLPQFTSPKLEGVTVAMLLDMTSGLASYTQLESFNRLLDTEPHRAWRAEELVELGLAEPVHFAPGKGWDYSNTNTVMLGLVVERYDGVPLEQSFERRIFSKLGLRQTLLPAITSNTIPEPHPQGYMYGTNVSTLVTTALPEDQQRQAQEGQLQPGDYTDLNPSWGWAAGAAISTASDLLRYVQALVMGGLISEKLQQERLASVKPVGDAGAGYGLALASFGPMLGHDGSLPGYSSFMGHDPKTDTSLIVLTTLQSSPAGAMVANEIARPIIGELL